MSIFSSSSLHFLKLNQAFIFQISDKDLSLLEERIKRASKSRSAESRRSMLVPLSASGRPVQIQQEVCSRIINHNVAVMSSWLIINRRTNR